MIDHIAGHAALEYLSHHSSERSGTEHHTMASQVAATPCVSPQSNHVCHQYLRYERFLKHQNGIGDGKHSQSEFAGISTF
jgi:hypothetical protein